MFLSNKYKCCDGYYNLGKALEDGEAVIISDENARIIYLYDCINEKNFCFKYAERSGGYHNIANKVVYESLISRMVKRFMPAVQYYPARINNELGVICDDWDNELETYSPLYTSILNKPKSALYEEFFTDGKIYSDRIIRKLSKTEDIIDYKPELLEFVTEDVYNNLLKIPEHFMVGNFDFNVKNFAVNNNVNKSNKFLSFDFGFNAFCMLEQYLCGDSNFNKNDIYGAYEYFFNCFHHVPFGIGFRLNIADYDTFENFIKDFKHGVRNYPNMKHNLEESINTTSKNFDNAMIELVEKDDVRMNIPSKIIAREVINYNLEELSKCL